MLAKILDKKIFDTKVTTQDITKKEKIVGYMIGPCGALLINGILGGSFLNMFYTDVIGIGNLWKGLFLVIFPVVAKIVDAITNFLMGWIIEKTRTKQGKARPYILISAFLVPISGILLYTIPNIDQVGQAIWIMFTYNLYFSFSFTIYYMSHSLMVPLSTRNSESRGSVAVLTQISATMITGIIAALIVPMVFLPMMGTSKSMWIMVMTIVSILAFPLIILEYYYTKERVTDESTSEEKEKIPYSRMVKAIFQDGFIIAILLYYLINSLANAIKINAMLYFCNYVLGTYSDGVTQTMINVIGGIPMGIGILAVWPIAKRIGKRNIILLGMVIMAIGSGICWMNPTNMTIMLIGQFIKNMGSLPGVYVFMALFADVLDHLEWKNGFRCDGIAMSIYSTCSVVLGGLSIGILNVVLNNTRYIKPFTATSGNLPSVLQMIKDAGYTLQIPVEQLKPTIDGVYTIAVNQNAATYSALTYLFVGLDVFACIICAVLLLFINVEKDIGEKQKIIRERLVKNNIAE